MINHQQHLRIAYIIAESSHAVRSKVGATIVKNGNIISMGLNGMPYGFNNQCEIGEKSKPEVLHAEANAILKCAISVQSVEGSTLYLTMSPCFHCAKLIIQAKIDLVVYDKLYRNVDGLDLLLKSNVKCKQIKLL